MQRLVNLMDANSANKSTIATEAVTLSKKLFDENHFDNIISDIQRASSDICEQMLTGHLTYSYELHTAINNFRSHCDHHGEMAPQDVINAIHALIRNWDRLETYRKINFYFIQVVGYIQRLSPTWFKEALMEGIDNLLMPDALLKWTKEQQLNKANNTNTELKPMSGLGYDFAADTRPNVHVKIVACTYPWYMYVNAALGKFLEQYHLTLQQISHSNLDTHPEQRLTIEGVIEILINATPEESKKFINDEHGLKDLTMEFKHLSHLAMSAVDTSVIRLLLSHCQFQVTDDKWNISRCIKQLANESNLLDDLFSALEGSLNKIVFDANAYRTYFWNGPKACTHLLFKYFNFDFSSIKLNPSTIEDKEFFPVIIAQNLVRLEKIPNETPEQAKNEVITTLEANLAAFETMNKKTNFLKNQLTTIEELINILLKISTPSICDGFKQRIDFGYSVKVHIILATQHIWVNRERLNAAIGQTRMIIWDREELNDVVSAALGQHDARTVIAKSAEGLTKLGVFGSYRPSLVNEAAIATPKTGCRS